MTFSAYDVDLTPATADLSLRVHGTVAIVVVAGHGDAAAIATTSVGTASPRSLPSGATPAV